MEKSLFKVLSDRSNNSNLENPEFKPAFFRIYLDSDKRKLESLIISNPQIKIFDTISSQLKELIKVLYPYLSLNEKELKQKINEHIADKLMQEYGVWVYYPWAEKLIHILDENEFIELRTNRNKHKITADETESLRKKTIGMIGLSVGKSIALTVVMERLCGEIRIADFDILELTNLNRIKTGLYNLGVQKTIIAAREIAEIDPYIKVTCFQEGITEQNIDGFFTYPHRLDLLIEECDSLDIKIFCRQKAKYYGIPVLMETNDKGMIDIERFDLQSDYPIFHGIMGKIDYKDLQNLSTEQKIPYVLKLVGLETASNRSKASLLEIGQSITNFPQLASSVVLGSALITDVSRRILLNHLKTSGRFYVDLENLIKDKHSSKENFVTEKHPELDIQIMQKLAGKIPVKNRNFSNIPNKEIISRIIRDAGVAPSSGNDQPWKWYYRKDQIILFHDFNRSYSFGDYNNMASYISLGTALENFVLSAHFNHLELNIELFPLHNENKVIATIEFINEQDFKPKSHQHDYLYDFIHKRHTSRKITNKTKIPKDDLMQIRDVSETIADAKVFFITKEEELRSLGEIISATDRIRLLHPHGHYDFFSREMRWTSEEALLKRNGMDINSLELPQNVLMALKILKDENIVKLLRDINGAQGFKKISVNSAITSSAMGLLTMPSYTPKDFVLGGRAVQRQWLKATQLGYAYQPMIAPLYLFPRINFGKGEGLFQNMIDELNDLRKNFLQIFPGDNKRGEIFLFRLFKSEDSASRSLRLPLEDILFFDN